MVFWGLILVLDTARTLPDVRFIGLLSGGKHKTGELAEERINFLCCWVRIRIWASLGDLRRERDRLFSSIVGPSESQNQFSRNHTLHGMIQFCHSIKTAFLGSEFSKIPQRQLVFRCTHTHDFIDFDNWLLERSYKVIVKIRV